MPTSNILFSGLVIFSSAMHRHLMAQEELQFLNETNRRRFAR